MNSLSSVNGKIELVIGPMFAGKTTELLRRLVRYEFGTKKCLVIKHHIDKRYSENEVVSHDKQSMGAVVFKLLEEAKPSVDLYDVVGIDEGQFFPDLCSFCEWAANRGKIVVVAALDGDFMRNPFGDVCKLIPMAENVTKLCSVCMSCKNQDAHFTRRICSGVEIEVVGGADKYIACCRACYHAPYPRPQETVAANKISSSAPRENTVVIVESAVAAATTIIKPRQENSIITSALKSLSSGKGLNASLINDKENIQN